MARLLREAQVTWAASAPANTVTTIDLPTDAGADGTVDVIVEVRNPSAITALTVRARTREVTDATFGGGSDRFPIVQAFPAGVPVNSPEGVQLVVKDWAMDANAGRLELSNDTVLGAGQGFTADVRVRLAGG